MKLAKKSELNDNRPRNRNRGGQASGRGGDGPAGADGEGGRGGAGGAGGGGGYGGGAGRSEDVAAYGEYVYVLQGKTLSASWRPTLKTHQNGDTRFQRRGWKLTAGVLCTKPSSKMLITPRRQL